MAAKTKVARLESEIEKCRSESNWSKAVDLARQVSSKSSALGNSFCFRLIKHEYARLKVSPLSVSVMFFLKLPKG